MEEILTINFAESFGTFSGLAALNVVIVNLITTYFKIKKGWIKQVISWIIPIVISVYLPIFQIQHIICTYPITGLYIHIPQFQIYPCSCNSIC